jgi:hypothetical protein
VVVADDEVVFHLFRAPAATAVRDLLERLPLAFERIVESVVVPAAWPPRRSASARCRGQDPLRGGA